MSAIPRRFDLVRRSELIEAAEAEKRRCKLIGFGFEVLCASYLKPGNFNSFFMEK